MNNSIKFKLSLPINSIFNMPLLINPNNNNNKYHKNK